MSSEDFNKLCMNEYKKSREDFFDKPIKFFSEAFKTNINSIIDEIVEKKNFDFSDYGTYLKSVFEKYKSRIEFHGGFIKQYKSIYKELNMIVDKYINDKRFVKDYNFRMYFCQIYYSPSFHRKITTVLTDLGEIITSESLAYSGSARLCAPCA